MIGRFLPSFASGLFKRKQASSSAASGTSPVFTSRFADAMTAPLDGTESGDVKARLRRLASSVSLLPYALSMACLAAGAALFAQMLSFPDKSELSDAIKRGSRVVIDLHDGRIYGRLRPIASRAGHGASSLSVSVSSEEVAGHAGRKNGASTVTVPVPGKVGEHGAPAAGKKKKGADASPLPAKDHSSHDDPSEARHEDKPADGRHEGGEEKGHDGAKSEGSGASHASSEQTDAHHSSERSDEASSSEHPSEHPSEEQASHKPSTEPAKPAATAAASSVNVAAAVTPPGDGVPMIAVVVKGVGLSSSGTEAAIALPSEFTLGFSPYSPNLQRSMKEAVGKGHEALLNIPMEAKDFNVRDAGPFSLSASLTEDENLGRLGVTLAQDVPLVGVYTDPDERFTARSDAVAPVLAELRKHGLMLAYGSGYASYTFFQEAAKQGFTQAAGADVQLDQVNDPEGVAGKLDEALAVAKRRGFAVVMASPYPATLKQLGEWAAGLKSEGNAGKPRAHVVPLSALKKSVEAQIAVVAGAKGKDGLNKKESEGNAGEKR